MTINYDKLSGMIITKSTLQRMMCDTNVTEVTPAGQTAWLNRWKVKLVNGDTYTVYTRGGFIDG